MLFSNTLKIYCKCSILLTDWCAGQMANWLKPSYHGSLTVQGTSEDMFPDADIIQSIYILSISVFSGSLNHLIKISYCIVSVHLW